MKYLIFIFLAGFPFSIFGQNKKFDFEFSLIFGACFSNDTIEINLNGVSVIKNTVIKTNVVGSANLSLTQKNKLTIKSFENTQVVSKVPIKEFLQVSVSVNGKWSEYKFSLKKGKILFAENCIEGDDGLKKPGFNIIQQDHAVYFF